MRSIHDPIQSTKEDLLERTSLAEEILRKLKEKPCPPVIGIYGGWGAGKSSLLNLIFSINQAKKIQKLHFELFDAWKYEATGNLLIPIISRLIKQIPRGGTGYAKRVIKITSLFFSDLALRYFTKTTISDVMNYKQELEKNSNLTKWNNLIDEIEETAQDFERLVKLILKYKKREKLVVFIDNLDRCLPENAIHLLESIRNFLSVPNCIWVISVDNNVIASYINQKYYGTKVDGHNYLEKIITEQYNLPSIGEYYTEELLGHLNIHFNIDLDFDRLSHLITPRKIIRSALKLKEFVEGDLFPLSDGGKQFVLCLILLYNLWPEFYEYLSTGSKDHISGVLANFYSERSGTSDEKAPLPEKFQDKNLSYFIQTTFLKKLGTVISTGNDRFSISNETMLSLMDDLKEIGLP